MQKTRQSVEPNPDPLQDPPGWRGYGIASEGFYAWIAVSHRLHEFALP